MRFGTINGNAAKAHDYAVGWLTIYPGITAFLSAIGPAKLARHRHSVINLQDGWFNAEADYSYPAWWESGLHSYAGLGIDIAAGILPTIGENQNESV